MIVNGADLWTRAATQRRVSLGCAEVDSLLRGGLRRGTLTEIYGESGHGKTQVCLQAAARSSGAVYISSEGFPSRRLTQMTSATDHIYVITVDEPEQLLSCVRGPLPALLARVEIDLVILDSVAAIFRVQYNNYSTRAQHLRELGFKLLRLAKEHDLSVLCVNQVTSSFTNDEPVPSLGLCWSNIISTRLLVTKTDMYLPLDSVAIAECNNIDSNQADVNITNEKPTLICNNSNNDIVSESVEIKRPRFLVNKQNLDSNKLDSNNDNYNFDKVTSHRSGVSKDSISLKNETDRESNNLERNDERIEMAKPSLENDELSSNNDKTAVRKIKVIFAPDLPNNEAYFVVKQKGIFGVDIKKL